MFASFVVSLEYFDGKKKPKQKKKVFWSFEAPNDIGIIV
jgi:hypothetical protein